MAALALTGLAATGCSEKEGGTTAPGAKSRITVRVADYQTADGSPAGEGLPTPAALSACLFEEGSLSAVYRIGASTEFDIDRPKGTLYVLSDADALVDLEALHNRKISETEWLVLSASTDGQRPVHFLSGRVQLTGAPEASVELTRSVARVDLHIRTEADIAIRQLTVRDAVLGTGLFTASTSGEAATGEVVFRPENPYTEDVSGAAYLYEQTNGEATLHAEAVIDGEVHDLTAALPEEVRRNRIYVATVTYDNVLHQAALTVEEWEKGDEIELQPAYDKRIVVDTEATELPTGATIDSDGTGLTLPFGATELRLVLACDNELELQTVEGYPLTVEAVGDTQESGLPNTYLVRKIRYVPGMPADEVTLRFRRKGLDEVYPEDRITLYLEANPTITEGPISFDAETHTFDFGRYVDNELGRFILPKEKEMLVEFDAGEDPWVKLVASEEDAHTIRVVGGWRPNDPTANGRTQSATLIIRNAADGSEREEYRISRRNYGLPVTWFHGVWWCKYNARGNSRDFDDQVLSATDPAVAAGKSVADYLRDCTPEEFYDLWGWAYQGDSGIGMRVVDNNGALVMDGFSTESSVNINKLPADALSPDGYELPSMEEFNRMFDATDYVWVMWSGTHQLRTPWEGHATIKREQRRRNDIVIGSVAARDLLYTSMWSPDFPQYEAVTWYGPGAQWNADGIMHSDHYNNILFSVYAPNGTGWYFAGSMAGLYLNKNGAGTKDTRILRFKKSPVEYIY